MNGNDISSRDCNGIPLGLSHSKGGDAADKQSLTSRLLGIAGVGLGVTMTAIAIKKMAQNHAKKVDQKTKDAPKPQLKR